jgi:hypothetical protein
MRRRYVRKILAWVATHVVAVIAGFMLGVYMLPILTAPVAPTNAEVESAMVKGTFRGEFRRDLEGSDFLHWGEGQVSVGAEAVALMGRIAPGPDYRLYLSPEFVEDETGFWRVKASAVEVGPVKTFENFIVPVSGSIDPAQYNTVVIWCESFSEFITAARYQ